jgi:hypothetical protein
MAEQARLTLLFQHKEVEAAAMVALEAQYWLAVVVRVVMVLHLGVRIQVLVVVQAVTQGMAVMGVLQGLTEPLGPAVEAVVAQGLAAEIKALVEAVLAYLVKAQAVVLVFIKAAVGAVVVVEQPAKPMVLVAATAAVLLKIALARVPCELSGQEQLARSHQQIPQTYKIG